MPAWFDVLSFYLYVQNPSILVGAGQTQPVFHHLRIIRCSVAGDWIPAERAVGPGRVAACDKISNSVSGQLP